MSHPFYCQPIAISCTHLFCSPVKQYTIQKRVTMIRSMKNFYFYQRFAYHISLLRQFVSLHNQNNNTSNNNSRGGGNDAVPSSVHGNNVWNSLKMKRGLGASVHSKDGSGHGNTEILGMSMGMGGMRRIVTATGSLSTMLHEGGEQRKV